MEKKRSSSKFTDLKLPLRAYLLGIGTDIKVSLSKIFPALVRLTLFNDIPISFFVSNLSRGVGVEYSWDFKFSQNLSDRESLEVSELDFLLEGVQLWGGVEDKRVEVG